MWKVKINNIGVFYSYLKERLQNIIMLVNTTPLSILTNLNLDSTIVKKNFPNYTIRLLSNINMNHFVLIGPNFIKLSKRIIIIL